jgi:8-amino-7-oxononanoate synthase
VSRAVWDEWVGSQVESVKDQGRWRHLRPLDGPGPDFRLADGTAVVSFASNDYLGLSAHPGVRAAAHDALERWGAGTGSSRLIVGDRPIHAALEHDLAAWRNCEAALVFPTGFQTNLGVLTTFGVGARIVSDELNHASIIDGARLARAEVMVYRHGDIDEAAHLVAGAPGRAVVVTDTVFSMDGDVADVKGLAEVCTRAGALLVLDDAHAVFGEGGLDRPDTACLRVGTLSKALGSQGGYVAGPRSWMDLLINRSRSFIFTTGLAPASAAAARAALAICRSADGDTRRAILRGHIDTVRPGHDTPIIPVVIGDEAAALEAADRLLQRGLLVPAIRPPTVPAGTSRLRLSLSSAHSAVDVARLVEALEKLA